MAKPRNSVLYLFDPLQQSPSTPLRDSSPELGNSDKENDVPAGDLTIFFSKTYGTHKAQEIQPRTPKGKLIDIGDTPAPERLWDDMEHEGSDADEELSETEAERPESILAPLRTPLADLDVEATPRPQQDVRRPLQAPVFSAAASPPHDEAPFQALLAAPPGSPLAGVINSINFSALAISDDVSPTARYAPALEAENLRPPSPFPEINVCAPETPTVSQFDLGVDEEPVVAPTTVGSTLRPPSSLTQLSPDDPRRASVDLYSSFHLQMQSAEMSFDLLNDKISFLGNGQDSFWAGGDDTMFEFDEEKRVPAVKEVRRMLTPPVEVAQEIDVPAVFSPTEVAVTIPLPMSPPPSTPSPRISPPRVQPHLIPAPPSPPTSPVSLDEPSLLLEEEPLPPPMAPPVPALRIVKKTFKLTGRKSIVSAPVPAPARSVSDAKPARKSVEKQVLSTTKPTPAPAPVAAPQPQPAHPSFKGVQRPPASMLAAGNVVIGLPPQGASHNTSASTSSSSSAGSSASRAVPGSRFPAGIQRPTLAAKERVVPRSTTAGPVRPVKASVPNSGITRTASAGPAISKPVSATTGVSGLRPPSRIAAPGTSAGTTSTLPRPASRLPGSSLLGLARHASTGGLTRPRVVTAPRAPTGGRF
ncbi:hypothetical protein C8Q78DRAFT_1078576 [Trametes maxima]|nr:hypothetical protein C8Q78DRAFT_1078576 [Trametes maxima]